MALIIYIVDRVLAACTDSIVLELTGGAIVKWSRMFTHFWQPDSWCQMLQKNSPVLMIVVIHPSDLYHGNLAGFNRFRGDDA